MFSSRTDVDLVLGQFLDVNESRELLHSATLETCAQFTSRRVKRTSGARLWFPVFVVAQSLTSIAGSLDRSIARLTARSLA